MAYVEIAAWVLLAIAALGVVAAIAFPTDRERVFGSAITILIFGAGLLWASGASSRIWEIARRPAMPADQAALSAIIHRWAATYENAENDVARRPMRAARDAELCNLAITEARAWTGRIEAVHAAGDQAGVTLRLTYRLSAGTTNNRISDALAAPGERTLIPPGSPLHAELAALRPGTAVRFSGQFFPTPAGCPRATGLTDSDSMTSPHFNMRLSAIAPLR